MAAFAFKQRNNYDFAAFQRRIGQRPSANCWERHSLATGNREWYGSKNYDEALQLVRSGWPEGAARIQKGMDSAQTLAATNDLVQSLTYDVAGALPDVGRYLAGDPECMIDWAPTEEAARPVLRIQLNGGALCTVDATQIENYGIAVLSCIDALEQTGRSVELVWGWASVEGGAWYGLTVTLKEAHEHFDIDRLAFALAHPSMLRRCAFALVELDDARFLSSCFGQSKDWPEKAREQGTWYMPYVEKLDCSTLANALKSVGDYVRNLASNDTNA